MGLTGQHPARRMDFDRLYNGLMAEVDAKHVTMVEDDDLQLFTYTRGECPWNEFSLLARGLILCPNQKKVIATPFPKFFNFAQVEADLPVNLPFDVFEKVDGSLGIIFYHNNQWRVATKGSFNSPQAKWATKFLNKYCLTDALKADSTYIVEIVYPNNRIVVDYKGKKALYLLAAYDGMGYEYDMNQLMGVADDCGFELPTWHEGKTLKEFVEIANKLSANEEGFVVRFFNGFRCKIKGTEYLRMHFLISQTTPLGVWRAMRDCENIKSMAEELPTYVRKDFNTIYSILDDKFKFFYKKIAEIHKITKHLDDKTLGVEFDRIFPKESRHIVNTIFACRKNNWLSEVHTRSRARSNLFSWFKPVNNVLDGYIPSSSLHTFSNNETL